jgi:uncharacterized protein with GYD domain
VVASGLWRPVDQGLREVVSLCGTIREPNPDRIEEGAFMALYLYELAYTAESLAAQIKSPQDRIEVAAKPVAAAVGGRIVAGGYSFGEYDIVVIYEAPDDESAAAVALAVAAGGAVKAARTTKLLDGQQWVAALRKAQAVTGAYHPAR